MRAAEGAAAPPANAGRDSKQLVTADPAEKMAARRPGDAAGALNAAAAVAKSSPTRSKEHERIASTLKRASLACFGALEDLQGGEGKNVAKGNAKPIGVLQFAPFVAEQPGLRGAVQVARKRSESDPKDGP